MNVFIWQRIQNATNNYHAAGGVVVFAETLDRAIELAAGEDAIIAGDETPDSVRAASGTERVFIFPDAGCC